MLRIIAATALLTCIATAAGADDIQTSITVSFSDLNLSHPADAKILAGRLQAAAQLVCRTAADGQVGVTAIHVMRDCVNDAINVALARIASAQTKAVKVYLADARSEP